MRFLPWKRLWFLANLSLKPVNKLYLLSRFTKEVNPVTITGLTNLTVKILRKPGQPTLKESLKRCYN